jgi:hypothetical protein
MGGDRWPRARPCPHRQRTETHSARAVSSVGGSWWKPTVYGRAWLSAGRGRICRDFDATDSSGETARRRIGLARSERGGTLTALFAGLHNAEHTCGCWPASRRCGYRWPRLRASPPVPHLNAPSPRVLVRSAQAGACWAAWPPRSSASIFRLGQTVDGFTPMRGTGRSHTWAPSGLARASGELCRSAVLSDMYKDTSSQPTQGGRAGTSRTGGARSWPLREEATVR